LIALGLMKTTAVFPAYAGVILNIPIQLIRVIVFPAYAGVILH